MTEPLSPLDAPASHKLPDEPVASPSPEATRPPIAAVRAAPAEAPTAATSTLTERLQARFEVLEDQPELVTATDVTAADPAAVIDPASVIDPAAITDLSDQLDLLRGQLERAFDDIGTRLDAAEILAADADTRAQVASARAANVLAAVDHLGTELATIAKGANPEVNREMRSAIDRLRARLLAT